MPSAPPRACRCGAAVPAGQRCGRCQQQRLQRSEQYRGSSTERGYDSRWRTAREAWLNENPLCAECERKRRVTAANEVDHIVPHRGDMDLFWDSENWQSLCRPCHSAKTAREDGGFGNRRK